MKKVIFAAILSMPLLSVAQPVTVTLPEKVEVVSVVPRYVTRIVQICTPYHVGTNNGSKIVEEMRCEDQYEQIQQGDTVTFRYKGRYVTQVFE